MMKPSSPNPVSDVNPRRWYHEPLLHFLLLGAVTFLFVPSQQNNNTGNPTDVNESPESLERRVQARLAEHLGRTPTQLEREEAIKWEEDRTLILDEAIRLGLHRDHPEVEKLLFDQLEPMISGGIAEPTDAQLRAWYAEEQNHKREQKIGFTQLFLPERADSKVVQTVLVSLEEGVSPDDLNVRVGRVQSARESTIGKRLPPPVVKHVLSRPLHRWEQVQDTDPPLIVRIEERMEMEPRPFEAVRESVRADWRADQRRKSLRNWIRQRRGDSSD